MPQRFTTRRGVLRLVLAATAALPLAARAATLPSVAVWKDPACGCCGAWIVHMRAAGFTVAVHDTDRMDAVKQVRGVPDALWSCHTAVIGGYVLEGHVPADDVRRLLVEAPSARGLAVPGMPPSAPGMDQPGTPYEVTLFGAPDGDRVYARH